MDDTYKSVLPSIVIEFQDGQFLDVDDIAGFTLSKTDDNLPQGVAIVDVRFGKRPWHSIKAITLNGEPGSLVAFDRFGYQFEGVDDEDADDDSHTPYDYVKMIIKFELSDAELTEIMVRRGEIEFVSEGEEDEIEDTGSVLQRSGDSV